MMARGQWHANWLHQARHPSRPRAFPGFAQVDWQQSPDWETYGSWALIKLLKGRHAGKEPATLCLEANHGTKQEIIAVQGKPVTWRI